jgi:DNA-binding NtrC family response regulator
MQSSAILIIDDDKDVLSALSVLLEDEFTDITTESNTNRIINHVQAKAYDVILLDMNFSAGINSGNEGLFWLSKIREAKPDAAVIMMTAYGKIDLAVEALKRGAKDFVLKPWDNEKLIATVKACFESNNRLKKKPLKLQSSTPGNIVQGQSKVMQHLQQQIDKVAATDASVLILGENGTGKDVVANTLHYKSLRAPQPFVSVDVSVLTPTLFESELFGHRKGSFTDAKEDRKGRFETAHGGSLFLDEIGNIPLALQAKLLTVLQKQEVIPVGSNTPVPFNIRLICATNAPLNTLVETGLFRQDLLYRINTITLTVPPLREREDDILILAEHFLAENQAKYNKTSMMFSDAAKQSLLQYQWPGNVRELQHTIEKAVILTNGNMITAEDLALSTSARMTVSAPRTKRLDDLEKEAMQDALRNNGGNIVQAAKELGITRQTLYNKMKRYGL